MSRFQGQYADDWKATAKAVKDDADWKCVRCRAHHSPMMGQCLTVHHFDGDKANNARWNLMALCQACHLSVQARVDPVQGLMAPPSPWCIPYIVGMVRANKTPEPLGYDEQKWRDRYVSEVGAWPEWAEESK